MFSCIDRNVQKESESVFQTSQKAHDAVVTLIRRCLDVNNVETTSCAVLTGMHQFIPGEFGRQQRRNNAVCNADWDALIYIRRLFIICV